MSNILSNLISSKKLSVRVLLGGIGAAAAILAFNVVDAKAQETSAGPLEAEMMNAAPELFGFLKTNFPDDFQSLVAQVEVTLNTGGTLNGVVANHLLDLRIKYAPQVSASDDASLAQVIEATIALQQTVLANEGPEACGRLAINGPAAFAGSPLEAKYEDLMLAQTVLLLKAAKVGHDTPVTRAAASEADWSQVTTMMTESGISQNGFAAIVNVDTANPELCPALISMLTAMNIDTSPSGALVRAEYLASAAGV